MIDAYLPSLFDPDRSLLGELPQATSFFPPTQKSTSVLFPDQTDLATFGFLYGTFPTAPTVFVIALQYGIETQQMAIGLVLCTFMAAPLMFLTANIFSMESSRGVENAIFTLNGLSFLRV